ncbi:cation:proton antiporter [Azospirillum picis]|uniref:CPA1 family monovalent cation:H+ antiporter n=1 Tax=Azospirillum picis TaxID=488438 RepID=A0ABU0MQP6_9PROT|nr:sodium:proton antiporter [Azospirillum picis]MBP2302216.1 CPA1 family monovalent cation:H+ antiporter [Azospirillum picis]MDQ0535795.1 CPA1 family monovalent cation:H+ antiporter [Azospirillum picis]
MLVFETLLLLLFVSAFLSMAAQRANVPYPTLLALGGAVVAFLPGAPKLDLPPELILALFVAPVLLDAAYDASLRDLRDNWRPVTSLVLVAVGLTTLAVAVTARLLAPDMPWAAAIALGALLAPPDAVAALAVMRQVEPPHRIRKVLEGESLLNDASALLLYKLAVGAAVAGGFGLEEAVPAFALVTVGSVAAGWCLARLTRSLIHRIDDVPTSVIIQFVVTFGVWLLAERLGLSPVVTVVVFGLTAARSTPQPARLRVPSFAVWETVTFVLNVLAFTLIGLQLGPILDSLDGTELLTQSGAALIVLAVVVAARLLWAMAYTLTQRGGHAGLPAPPGAAEPLTVKGGLVIGWSGMRGIVTLAAALALPADFPGRDFIQLTAFVVVLGTLVVQGLTLRPLLVLLRLPEDNTVETELSLARAAALKAAMAVLDGDDTPAADRLRLEYRDALVKARKGRNPSESADNRLRRSAVPASRRAIADLRRSGAIGDDAYRRVEEELDWLELSSGPAPAGE